MKEIKRYDLHKDDYSKLHFEVNDSKKYILKNLKHASISHRHSFYQIIWFKKSGRHYIDYEVIDHPENTLFFINKNQIHKFCSESSNEGYLFHFNDLFVNKYVSNAMERFSTSIFNEIGNNFLYLPKVTIEKIALIISAIQDEMVSKDTFYKEQIFHYFQIVLFEVERLRKNEFSMGANLNSEYTIAIAFKKLIFEKIDLFLNIDEYANSLGTNSKNLTYISKKYLLNTPANVVKESKLMEAKRLLSNQNIAIKEVAFALGFEDPTYFTKYFKKGTGFTPKAFQQVYL